MRPKNLSHALLVSAALSAAAVSGARAERFSRMPSLESQAAEMSNLLAAVPALWTGPSRQPLIRMVGHRENAGRINAVFVHLVKVSEPAVLSVRVGQRGVGSGFLIDPDGLAVTNFHVVGNTAIGQAVDVYLQNGGRASALVVAKSRHRDLALLRVVAAGRAWPHLRLASRAPNKGETVLAFGSPFGMAGSVSRGIVSGHDRNIAVKETGSRVLYLQTDAPINPGNSGGPLLALDGRVVGVNASIATRGGGSDGVGFAISAEDVAAALEQFRRTGNLNPGRAGLQFGAPPPGNPELPGAYVAAVTEGLPASNSGLQAGDRIVKVSGKALRDGPVDAILDAMRWIGRFSPGERVSMIARRDGRLFQVAVTLAEAPETPPEDEDDAAP